MKQPWIKWDGLSPPSYIHMIRYEILLKDGRIRFCDIGEPVMWENFGGLSDIDSWRPFSGSEE